MILSATFRKSLPCLLAAWALSGLTSCEKDKSTNLNASKTESKGAPAGMVWIDGGTFAMGTSQEVAQQNPVRSGAEESPVHRVIVEGFFMDETEVTNQQFKEFVEQQ